MDDVVFVFCALTSINMPCCAVDVKVKARQVTVTGPRGTLKRDFRHLTCAIEKVGKHRLRVDIWFGIRKQIACLRTLTAHIENMMTGVTKGFCYKMKLAYAHFPMTVNVTGDKNDTVEIRNVLGERLVRRIKAFPGVTVKVSEGVKDQIELQGNDIEAVSRSAALIHDSCLVRNKDIRRFLDGIYVTEKGPIGHTVSVM